MSDYTKGIRRRLIDLSFELSRLEPDAYRHHDVETVFNQALNHIERQADRYDVLTKMYCDLDGRDASAVHSDVDDRVGKLKAERLERLEKLLQGDL